MNMEAAVAAAVRHRIKRFVEKWQYIYSVVKRGEIVSILTKELWLMN